MQILLTLTGRTPLLLKNGQTANPDHPATREIATITGKRKKTGDDRLRIAELEWYAALYINGGPGLVYPTANVRKCLINAGKITKQGAQVTRAISFSELEVPLVHDGPDDPKALYADERFHDYRPVGIGAKRTMRMRPRFGTWLVELDGVLLEDVMDLDDLRRIGARAGQAEGLGDNRVNGFGRFAFDVEVAS
jgi:hypothetical protein